MAVAHRGFPDRPFGQDGTPVAERKQSDRRATPPPEIPVSFPYAGQRFMIRRMTRALVQPKDQTDRSELTTSVIRAFNANHVVRLTALSHSQLRYWDDTGFFKPRYAFENRRSPFSRVYSFQDVVGLRTLSHLRKVHHIPLQQLRKVARRLSEYRDRPWSELILYVLGKEVYFREPETERVRGVLSGQYTLVHLESIIHDLTSEAAKLKQRSPDQIGHIERHRFVVHNAWVIAGTRIPTRAIWRFHQAGYSADKIIQEYPPLTRADIQAAVRHEEKLAAQA